MLLNIFFPIIDTCLSCADMARQNCAMVPRWRFLATFLRPVFAASRVQRISDLHSKFSLRPHHVPKYGKHPDLDDNCQTPRISTDIQSPTAEIRRGKRRRNKQDENIMVCPIP